MKIPQEIQVVLECPLSCLGRVVPAALAPVAPVLAEYADGNISDMPSAVIVSAAVAMTMAFFAALSAWLSNGATAARQDIESRNGNGVAK